LRVRIPLTSDVILILLFEALLFQALKLRPSLLLGLRCHLLLIELSLTQLTKRTCCSQLLLEALHAKPSTELTGLLHRLLSSLILPKRLLLSLQLRGLIKLLRLKASLGTQLLNPKERLKVLLPCGKASLLVSHRCLHLSRTVSTKLLCRLLECLLPTGSLNALQLTLKVPVCLRLKQRLTSTTPCARTDTLRLQAGHLTSVVLHSSTLLLFNHTTHIGRHVVLHRLRTKPVSTDLLRPSHLILL
jgi:hypothetical protein